MEDKKDFEGQGEAVTLLDENGVPVRFEHLLTFKHLEETYVALLPIDDVEDVGEDEVLLLRVASGEKEDRYLPIESEVLLEEVFEVFSDLFDEMLDDEEAEEDFTVEQE